MQEATGLTEASPKSTTKTFFFKAFNFAIAHGGDETTVLVAL